MLAAANSQRPPQALLLLLLLLKQPAFKACMRPPWALAMRGASPWQGAMRGPKAMLAGLG
jgi:hypothetical protein